MVARCSRCGLRRAPSAALAVCLACGFAFDDALHPHVEVNLFRSANLDTTPAFAGTAIANASNTRFAVAGAPEWWE